MKQTLAILGCLAVFPVGVAMADDDCIVPMADWQPRDAVLRMAADNGWSVRRIKIDDGCYETLQKHFSQEGIGRLPQYYWDWCVGLPDGPHNPGKK